MNFIKTAKINNDVKFNTLQERVVNNDHKDMILAHAVGSGKTLSGIAKFEKLKEQNRANKALIVTPASLRHNYANNGIKKFTDSKVNIVGNKSEIAKKTGFNVDPNSDYNIISYEMFRKNPEEILEQSGADTIIADEIHKIKNAGTSTLKSFYDSRDKYKNFIGLTGSVISNKISDIYNLVDVASDGNHNLGETRKDFEDKFLRRSNDKAYAGLRPERIPVVGFKHKKLLKSELAKYVDYADIDDIRHIAKIPKKNVSVKKVPISKEQAVHYRKLLKRDPKLYELIRKKRLETFKDDELSRAFNDLIEARKLMNSPGAVLPGISLSESAKSPKIKTLLDDMENHLNNTEDGQAIILTNLIRGGIDTLEAGLKDRNLEYGKFIGKGNAGITEESRQQDVNDFNDRKKRIMLISGAGAEGISLGDTTWEGVLDGHYNPERMNQMEARGIRAFGQSHRPEKDRVVNVDRYIATMPKTLGFKSRYKTPDELIYEIANNKDKQNKLLYDLLKKNHKKLKPNKED